MNAPAADPPPSTPLAGAAPPQRLRDRHGAFELLVGLGVLLISLVSLFVAVSANRTQERMLAASVWPTLQFGTSNVSVEGVPQVTLDLLNRGVGPARIRWAELSHAGTAVGTLGELLQACCDHRIDTVDSFSSGLHQRVIGSDEWVQLVRLPQAGNDAALWQRLDAARHQVRLRACYCSVLDDCWLLDSDREEPDSVDACPAPPAKQWGR